jgi:hypothetical protein
VAGYQYFGDVATSIFILKTMRLCMFARPISELVLPVQSINTACFNMKNAAERYTNSSCSKI